MKKKLIHYILMLLIAGFSFISCEKPPAVEDPRILQEDKDLVLETGTDLASTCWNIYCYAKQIYLWNEALPPIKEFDPKKYAEGMEEKPSEALKNLLKEICRYSLGEDRFSSIWSGEKLIAQLSNTSEYLRDKGLALGYEETLDSRFYSIVTLVYPGSPAEKAGLKRGHKITYATTNGLEYQVRVKDGNAIKKIIMVKDINYSISTVAKVTVEKVKSDNNITTKVGYLLYNGFDNNKKDKDALNDAFGKFRSDNVTELVLDLRYNSGGRVAMIDYLFNLIATSELEGRDLRGSQFNNTITSGSALLLKAQPTVQLFEEQYMASRNKSTVRRDFWSFIDINNIYVIVSNETSSASETLINALKYYADRKYFGLKIIGKQTAGKDVGSFLIDVNEYKVNLMSFRPWCGEPGNFVSPQGFSPDFNCPDDFDFALGDPNEKCFAAALRHIQSGSWYVSGNEVPVKPGGDPD